MHLTISFTQLGNMRAEMFITNCLTADELSLYHQTNHYVVSNTKTSTEHSLRNIFQLCPGLFYFVFLTHVYSMFLNVNMPPTHVPIYTPAIIVAICMAIYYPQTFSYGKEKKDKHSFFKPISITMPQEIKN